MSRETTNTLKEEVFAQSTDKVFVTLLTLSHPDLTNPIRVCDDPAVEVSAGVRGTVSRGEDFVFLPFELVPPGQSGDSLPTGRLKVDNVSREIIQAVRTITSPADVLIEVVMSDAPDVVEAVISGFQLRNIKGDSLTVEGELSTVRFDMEPFPCGSFTPSQFPGMR